MGFCTRARGFFDLLGRPRHSKIDKHPRQMFEDEENVFTVSTTTPRSLVR